MWKCWLLLLLLLHVELASCSCNSLEASTVKEIRTWEKLEEICGPLETHTIPESIRQLVQLRIIQLDSKQLQTLPESFGQLTALTKLSLENNQLQSLPDSFGQLTALEWLSLENNQLVTLPESFSQLTVLRALFLGKNYFRNLPESFGKLSALTELSLFSNQLYRLSESFGQLTALESLGLSENQLESLPNSFAQLTALTGLALDNNQLVSLPESFGQLTTLDSLSLRYNGLQSLPKSFGKLIALRKLFLEKNQLESLPESFGQLAALDRLVVWSNRLQSLPESLGRLADLTWLVLDDNQLQSLPESFGQLTALTGLQLHNNQLQSLPQSFGQLTALSQLHLYNNQLQSLPESFGQLTALADLHLYNNQLQSLPESFGQLTAVPQLDLRNNQLQSLPESFCQLVGLRRLSLENNRLQSLPESFGKLTELTWLYLSSNQLQSLPESFCQLTALTYLFLNNIRLRTLPEVFGQLTALAWLDVNDNQLQSFPESFGQLTALSQLNLESNQLQSLPESFGQFTALSKLHLGKNYLQSLPDSFGNLSNLKYLNLSHNEFKTLPEVIFELRELNSLFLENNQLTSLPSGFSDVQGITLLGLHGNPFVCDRRSLGWSADFDFGTLMDPDETKCGAVNEFADFPVHRIRFQEDEPESSPEDIELRSDSPHNMFVTWHYLLEEFDSSSSYVSFSSSEYDGTDLEPEIPDTSFDCDSILPSNRTFNQAKLIFQVEWRSVGEAQSSWTSMCTKMTHLSISDLIPNSLYDVRVRAVNIRWDVRVGFQAQPRLSAGPRSLPRRIKTQPGVPEGAPQNLEQDFNVTRETSLAIRWDPPAIPNTDNLYYTVRMNDKIVGEYIKETVFTVGSLEPKSLYSIMVRASSEAGAGIWSEPLQARTIPRCPRGFQRRELEGYVCMPCPQDTFRDDELSKDCVKCPLDRPHTLSTGSVSSADCVDGSLFLEFESSLGAKEDRLVKDGYWRISNRTMDFRECPRIEFCKPKKRQATWFWNSSDQYCSPGHVGVLCSKCEDGFGLKELGCEKCDETNKARDHRMLFLWAVVGVFVVLTPCLLIVVHLLNLVGTSSTSLWFSCWQPDAKMIEDIAVAVRVLIGFFQVFLQYTRATGLHVLGGQGSLELLVNLDVSTFLRRLSVACAWVTTFYHGLFMYTLFPLVAVMLMFSVVACAWRAPRKASALGLAVWTTMQLMFFVYPGVSSTIFNTFRYARFWTGPELGVPSRTLAMDYTVDFDTEESKWWRLYAGVMIAVYPVGVVALFCVMVRVGKKLEMKSSKSEIEESVSHSVAFLSRPYTWAYFECYELLRKLVLTSGFLLVQQESRHGGNIFFTLMCMFFTVVMVGLRPYISSITFRFATISAALLVLIGFVPLCLLVIEEMTTDTAEALTMWIAIAECVAFMGTIGGHIWLRRRRERKGLVKSEDTSPSSDEDDCEKHASGEFIVVND